MLGSRTFLVGGGRLHIGAFLVLMLCPAVVVAQTANRVAVTGRALAGDTGTPLAGALVELEDSTGGVASGLTGSRGRFFLRVPGPGRYRISVGTLGYRTIRTDWFELGADAVVTRDVEVPLEPVGLAGIRVSTGRRCDVASGGSDLARVWTEARKGLTAVALTDSLALNYRLAFVERALDREWGTVLAEASSRRSSHAIEPFRSAPVDALLEDGFIQEVGDTTVYFGPDARLLLSPEFLDRYCFALVRDRPGELGLEFTPVRRDRRLSQIEGVVWLDEVTAEPRRLTYTYLNPPLYAARFEIGGEAEYQRLPTGAWIVRRWMIRTPQPMTAGAAVPTRSVGYIRETSGEVVAVSGPDFELALDAPAGAVSGRALTRDDEPLGNVLVYLNGTVYADTTTPGGAFRLTGVRPGRYHLAAYHGQLGDEPAAVAPVEVESDAEATAVLRVTLPAVVAAGCPYGSGSAIRGRVIEPASGTPLPDAVVELRPGVEAIGGPTAARAAARRTRAGTDGGYRFCDVPEGPVRLIAHLPWTAPVQAELVVPPDTVLDVDLNLVVEASPDAPGRIVGRVLEAGTDRPLEGATVRVAGATAITNPSGAFALGDIAPGTVPVRASFLGYADAEGTVELGGGQTVDIEVRLTTEPIDVEPITVTVRAVPRRGRLAGFTQRLESGWGTFVLAEEIQERQPIRLTQILQEHGLTELRNGRELWNGRLHCPPNIYIDGTKVTHFQIGGPYESAAEEAGHNANLVHPSSVAGIEIYRGPGEVPGIFGGSDAKCGAVVIWTKGFGGGPERDAAGGTS